jgi:imidazolonepropionase-like amidohydrolase
VTATITACRRFASLLVLPLALGVSGETKQRPQTDLVITHVTVIDATGAPAKPEMTIVITDGRIAALGKTGEVRLPKDGRILDASGKFLIPGLWDMHGHLTYAGDNGLALLIENGITGVRDMGGDLDRIDAWRKEIAEGRRLGPHIVRAGPFVDGPKPHLKDRLTVNNAAEARRAVDALKRRGVDFIKVHNGLSRESFFAVAEEARKQGIPLAVHVPSGLWTRPGIEGVSVAEASDAGAKSIEHVEILLESSLYRKGATAKTIEEAIAENSGETGAALFARLVRNGTCYVPTLVAYYRGFVLWSGNPKETAGSRAIHLKNLKLVETMHRAGVEIMAGSDFSDWALVPGVDLHNELTLFVEAGFTPMEALQSATMKPAKFFGKQDSLGTIEKGKIADLVLLDANPLEDISHTRKINSVIIGGKLVPISKLRDQFLDPAVAR